MYTVVNQAVEYEPFQAKSAQVGPTKLIMVSDNVTVHTELIQKLNADVATLADMTVAETAKIYAEYLRVYKADRAWTATLAPFCLTLGEFLAKQKDYDQNFIIARENEFTNHWNSINAQSLVVGCDANMANIFEIDNNGLTTCHSDVGFASIGSGRPHANAQFMLRSYVNNWGFYPALLLAYGAKKSAEIAPGVGATTDLTLITRDGTTRIFGKQLSLIEKTYAAYRKKMTAIEKAAIESFMKVDKARITLETAQQTSAIAESKKESAAHIPESPSDSQMRPDSLVPTSGVTDDAL
jgi:hypothetical protein